MPDSDPKSREPAGTRLSLQREIEAICTDPVARLGTEASLVAGQGLTLTAAAAGFFRCSTLLLHDGGRAKCSAIETLMPTSEAWVEAQGTRAEAASPPSNGYA